MSPIDPNHLKHLQSCAQLSFADGPVEDYTGSILQAFGAGKPEVVQLCKPSSSAIGLSAKVAQTVWTESSTIKLGSSLHFSH